jgi:hypothetical protein
VREALWSPSYARNPNYKRAERQKYSDSESSDSSDSSDVELDPSEDEEPDRKKDGKHKPLSDKKIRDKAYTKIRVQQQPDGTIFIFTDGSHIAKDKSKTTEDLCAPQNDPNRKFPMYYTPYHPSL